MQLVYASTQLHASHLKKNEKEKEKSQWVEKRGNMQLYGELSHYQLLQLGSTM